MFVHETNKLLVSSTSVGSDISYFHKQTEYTLIRQLLQELPDLGLLCLLKHEKVSLWGKGLMLFEMTSELLFPNFRYTCIISFFLNLICPWPYSKICSKTPEGTDCMSVRFKVISVSHTFIESWCPLTIRWWQSVYRTCMVIVCFMWLTHQSWGQIAGAGWN